MPEFAPNRKLAAQVGGLADGPLGSAGSLGTLPRNYSPPALFSSTARQRHPTCAHQFGERHLYASVIVVECTTSTRDEHLIAKIR